MKCRLVEGMGLGLGPLPGYLPPRCLEHLQQMRGSTGQHGGACQSDWGTHLGRGKAGAGGSRASPQRQAPTRAWRLGRSHAPHPRRRQPLPRAAEQPPLGPRGLPTSKTFCITMRKFCSCHSFFPVTWRKLLSLNISRGLASLSSWKGNCLLQFDKHFLAPYLCPVLGAKDTFRPGPCLQTN